jgi:cell division protein ZapE
VTPVERYQQQLQQPDFSADAAQAQAINQLQTLYLQLVAIKPSPLGWRRQRKKQRGIQGLYLWGAVGCGKTLLMDMFFASLPFPEKLRLHFHQFMATVHQQLTGLSGASNPLVKIADQFAQQARVLCFDEFFVEDITDAMILGKLFSGLLSRGVVLVCTSNSPPDQLYRDGLQRQRFLPTIALIKQHCQISQLVAAQDYRLRTLTRAAVYHSPLDVAAQQALARCFSQLTGVQSPQATGLDISGRLVQAKAIAQDVAWFSFTELCEGPRSQRDYMELARLFHTVLIADIPQLTSDKEEATRRFISLVDEFYQHRVKLIISAAVPVAELYQGQQLRFIFQRTKSRLIEMQTKEFLARPHQP